MSSQETLLKQAHIALMKHPQTALYSGVMLMGESAVEDGNFTAYTDGVNKKYCRQFLEKITNPAKRRGLILHENLHVALKQLPRHIEFFRENAKLANVAADFVVNDIIYNITGKIGNTNERIVELPDGALYDSMFHDWSMRQIWDYLKKQNPPPPPRGKGDKPCDDGNPNPNGPNPGDSGSGDEPADGEGEESGDIKINGNEIKTIPAGKEFDEHDYEKLVEGMDPEDVKNMNDAIDKALREGGMLAGRMGGQIPRAISDLLTPKVDWKDALRDIVSSSIRGKDEFTWRRLNKRQLVNDLYLPSIENETVGEVVVAIDTSGSISGEILTGFATELASICDLCEPEKVRVLWWDTDVHGEQIFEGNYTGLAKMLKPVGGGGTRVGCVSDYFIKKKINADCVIVFTDGYVEPSFVWDVIPPTLWMVTENESFHPPVGKKVMINND
jgi:predicted metal-dependent peptidase